MHLSDDDGSQSNDRNSNYRHHNFCAPHSSGVLIVQCAYETCGHIEYSLFHRSSCFDEPEDVEVG